jgi:hypothetical protein
MAERVDEGVRATVGRAWRAMRAAKSIFVFVVEGCLEGDLLGWDAIAVVGAVSSSLSGWVRPSTYGRAYLFV